MIDGEIEFRLFPVINGQALQEQRAESRSGASANGIEHEEALETSAVVGQPAPFCCRLRSTFANLRIASLPSRAAAPSLVQPT